jgi:hypothetical protein
VFSADTMLDADLDVSAFDAELRRLVEGYLRP